jgi:hypothetical protein
MRPVLRTATLHGFLDLLEGSSPLKAPTEWRFADEGSLTTLKSQTKRRSPADADSPLKGVQKPA